MTPSLSRPRARWLAFATAAAAASLVVAACGGSSSSSTGSGTGTVKAGGTATFALDEDVAGFNVLQANDNEFVLQEINDQIWPQAFLTPPNLTPTLNKDLLTSATVTSTQPADRRLQDQPQGGLVGRHAHLGDGLHLQLAGQQRQLQVQGPGRRRLPGGQHGRLQRHQVGHQLRRRQDRDGRVLRAVQRLAGPVLADDPGPHRAEGRLQQRVPDLRPRGAGLGRPVQDPELHQGRGPG